MTFNTEDISEHKLFENSSKGSKQLVGPGSEYYPHVRFGEDQDGVYQSPELLPVDALIPEDAVYASPVYLLTSKQKNRLQATANPYAVPGSCIATELQDDCEEDDRVLYPVHVESDAEVRLDVQIGWIRKFIETHFPLSPYDCEWYYSGGRSIHVHAPLFVQENGLKMIREAAKEFDADLDPAIYSRKRPFRLPGVIHDTGNLPKTPIEPGWEDAEIICEASVSNPKKPDTYQDLLTEIYGSGVLTDQTSHVWKFKQDHKSEPIPWEPRTDEPVGDIREKWKAYNRHHFSPYANTGNGHRSLLVTRIVGGAFGESGRTYLPCRIRAAIGGDHQYTILEEYGPVYLSEPDYSKVEKRNIGPGDEIIIIGGQSRQSRIFTLSERQAKSIQGELLHGDVTRDEIDPGRLDKALRKLEKFGYDIGAAGKHDGSRGISITSERAVSGTNRARKLQERAETGNIKLLSHQERLHLTNRLLRIMGRDDTEMWFQKQYGEDYDRELTETMIESVLERWDDYPDP